MKSAQISKYAKAINITMNETEMPKIMAHEVLVAVKAAGVNPVDLLIASGSIKLMYNYKLPLTLGNELAGVIVDVGKAVSQYKIGDKIMARLPVTQIGAFSEYVAIDENAIALIPSHLSYIEAAAVPLTGLTAYQTLNDVLKANAGESIFLPGGTGGLGAMLIPIAKQMGLKIITTGSEHGRVRLLAMGVDTFINYKEQNYADVLSDIDYVIDTLGPDAFREALGILKPKGKLVSLKGVPNYRFAKENGYPLWKKALFKLAGSKFDKMASAEQKEYHFFFVQASGKQLQKVAEILEKNNIKSTIDSVYHFSEVEQALNKVALGHAQGKVVITFE